MPTKKHPRINPHSVNMPELFGDLIRERSLYGVLESLAETCTVRADHSRKKAELEERPSCIAPLAEAERDFFDAAAMEFLLLQRRLETEWGDRAPLYADGDTRRFERVMGDAAREYFRALASVINNPAASAEEKQRAAAELKRNGEGTIWRDRETGKPSFELAEAFRKITEALADPNTPEDEKREIASGIQDFVGR
jgi:hypothetical protein